MDMEITKERLAYAQTALRSIIAGGKVEVTRDTRSWLVHQLERMHDQGYIASPAKHYYYYDDEPAPEAVTTIHPMPHMLRSNRLRMIRELKDDSKWVDIQGSQIQNKAGEYRYEIPEHVKGFITPRADIFAADEMVAVLSAKIEAYERQDYDNPILKKPLVISNQRSDEREGYWGPFLEAFGITGDAGNPEFFREALNVYIARTRLAAIETVQEWLPREMEVPPPPPSKPLFQPGTILFFNTTTLQKLIDHILGFRQAGARVHPLHLAGTIAESPEETAQSAEGNAFLKGEAAQMALARVPDEVLRARFNISREQAGTLVDDTYSYFKDKRLLKYFDLTGCEHLIDREKWLNDGIPFPGVEIGPIINACNGPANFCKRANEAFQKLEEALEKERQDLIMDGRKSEVDELVPAIDRTMVEGSAIIYQPAPPYKPDITKEELAALKIPLYVVTGSQHFYFTKKPSPENTDPRLIETYHYQVPIGIPRAERKSRAELQEEGNMRYEPRAKADAALCFELGVDINAIIAQQQVSQSEPFNVLISMPENGAENPAPWNFSKGIYTCVARDRLKQLEDIETDIRSADGILLMPHPVTEPHDVISVTEKKFKFWSFVVAKQTDPRDMNKPFALFDPEGTWNEEMEELRQLYFMGALKEKPELIVKQLRTVDETVRYFTEARDNRYPPVRFDSEEKPEMVIPQSGKFNVAIFCSASFENEQMLATAHNLGYNLAMSDFGLVYGGGSRYMMGEVNEGVQAARKAGKTDAWIAGSNIDHLVQREGKPPENLNDYYSARNIYKRIDYMLGTADCAIVAPGGPGTMQEMAAAALYLTQNHTRMRGKEIVVINDPIQLPNGDGTHKTISYFDSLTQFLPEDVRKNLNIHFVDSPEAAKEKVEEIRARSEKAASLTYRREDRFENAWEQKEQARRGGRAATAQLSP